MNSLWRNDLNDHFAVINVLFINPAIKYFTIVIVRLDRTIQNLLKRMDSPIKSGNDEPYELKCLLVSLMK
jgi:hypothetical protein